jgi:hypothetical protein
MGLGTKISEFAAGIFKNDGKLVYTKTISPALGLYRDKSSTWEGTAQNGKVRSVGNPGKYKNKLTRASFCHKDIGEDIKGYEDLILPIADMRKSKTKMITLF